MEHYKEGVEGLILGYGLGSTPDLAFPRCLEEMLFQNQIKVARRIARRELVCVKSNFPFLLLQLSV